MQLTMIQTPISADGSQSTSSNMDFILEKIWNKPNAPLEEFFGIIFFSPTYIKFRRNMLPIIKIFNAQSI